MISLKRRRKLLSRYNRGYAKLYRNYMGLMIVGLISFLIGLVVVVFDVYRYQVDFLIKKVFYPTTSMAIYDDIDLYTTITSLYKKRYYLDIKRFDQHKLLDVIQSQYPFVSDIVIKTFNNNKLVLVPVFKEPLLIVYHRAKRFALYQDNILPLDSGNTLGQQASLVYLPQYLSGSVLLSGLLYSQQNIEKFANDVHLLYQLPLSGVVTYMPGGEKYVYGSPNHYIYFNAKKPISGQIQQFYELLHNYSKFSSLQKIDIGSTDFPIVK